MNSNVTVETAATLVLTDKTLLSINDDVNVSKTLVVIDVGVADYQKLADSVVEDAEVLILNPDVDGIQQITTNLQNHRHVETLHIVSHGTPGSVTLGNTHLSLDTLEYYAWNLQSWFASISPSPGVAPQILLYGCNVAAGDAGAEFIEKLHRVTGANIAASTTLVGNAALGGNWKLDATVGQPRVNIGFNSETLAAYSAVLSSPILDVSGSVATNGSTPKILASDLTIGANGISTLSGARVSIGNNFNANQDRLGINGQANGSSSGINWSYDTSTGILELTGDASIANYEDLLRQVTYSSNGTPTGAARDVQFSLGSSLANSENGHFYEFVAAPSISWTNARDAAAAKSYFGLQGYLTTVTSANENVFIASKLQGEGWMGASDVDVEGQWKWMVGPEAGTVFWSGNGSGTSVGGNYDNWASGEPNDAPAVGGEDYAHFLTGGQWNDYPLTLNRISGYVVEYGGMSGDPTLQITGTVTVNLDAIAPTVSLSSESSSNLNAPFTVTATFSETVTGFSPSDISVTNGSVSNFTENGNTYTFLITPDSEGEVSVNVGAGVAQDATGNNNTAASSALVRTFDSTPPTVSLSSESPSDLNAPFTVTATFSETITGFSPSDVSVTNGSVSDFTENGNTYTFLITPDSEGKVSVNVGAGVAQDATGNNNTAASSALVRTFDSTPPTIPVKPVVDFGDGNGILDGDDYITNNVAPTFEGNASAGTTIEIFVGDRSLGTTVVDEFGSWSFVPPTDLEDGTYPVTVVAIDNAGNQSDPSEPFDLTIDTQPSTVAVVKDGVDVRDSNMASVNIEFNEVVKDFDLSDVVLTRNGNPVSLEGANLTTSDNKTWTLSNIADLTKGSGNYQVEVLPGSVTDLVGNALTSGSQDSWLTGYTADSLPPIDFEVGELGVQLEGTRSGDRLNGTSDRDVLKGLDGNDILRGRRSNDRIEGGAGNDRLLGGLGDDILLGGLGNDILAGKSGSDRLVGGDGNDILKGRTGNDVLVGSMGEDELIGGAGKDTYVFNNIAEGGDFIKDFKANDLIDLRGIFEASEFNADNRFAQYDQFIRLVQVGADTKVRVDADGLGSGTAFTTLATLENTVVDTVRSTNFVLG